MINLLQPLRGNLVPRVLSYSAPVAREGPEKQRTLVPKFPLWMFSCNLSSVINFHNLTVQYIYIYFFKLKPCMTVCLGGRDFELVLKM